MRVLFFTFMKLIVIFNISNDVTVFDIIFIYGDVAFIIVLIIKYGFIRFKYNPVTQGDGNFVIIFFILITYNFFCIVFTVSYNGFFFLIIYNYISVTQGDVNFVITFFKLMT